MFVGHYAAALAAKAAEPKAPMWTLAAACQLIDIGWSSFIMLGIEHARVDPSLPGSSLVLYDMPWTHSLAGALVWSAAAALLVRVLLRLPTWASVVVGVTVFSHWLLDLWVHRPDLALWPGSDTKLGFAFWNLPVPEQATEIGLIAVCGAMWVASRKQLGRTVWPAVAFIAFLVVLQIAVMFYPTPEGPVGFQSGLTILMVYLLVTAVAALTDRRVAASG
jgi:hypothetical protein